MSMFPLLPDDVERYCDSRTTMEPFEAERIRIATMSHPKSYWLLGPVVAAFLRIVMRLLQPKSVLELGTFTGYATAVILSEASPQTEVISLERDPKNFSIAASNLAGLVSEYNLSLFEGDGLEWLESHSGRQFDLVVIDIDKTEIADSFEIIVQSVAPGGVLICDNALMKNRAISPQTPSEHQTDKFNQLLSRDARFLSVLLPVRDGLNISFRVGNHGR